MSIFSNCNREPYHLLYSLEDEGLLDPLDEIDLFSLHFIFIPRLNQQLETFRAAYCRHRLRTEHNRMALQLWTRGLQVTEDEAALTGILYGPEEELGLGEVRTVWCNVCL